MPLPLALVGTALAGALDLVKGWMQKKREKQNSEIKIAQAVTDAKIKYLQTKQLSDIAWENTALVKSGIKDEVMMIVILTPMVMSFIPGGAELVRNGFAAMKEALPPYWIHAFYALVAVSFGIRKWTDFMSIKKGG